MQWGSATDEQRKQTLAMAQTRKAESSRKYDAS